MRSKWFWMARIRSKLNIAAEHLVVFDNYKTVSPVVHRITRLYIFIDLMHDRPEFTSR
jgi:hypothetical protein